MTLLKVVGLAVLALVCAAPGLLVVVAFIYERGRIGCEELLLAIPAVFFLKWSWEIIRKALRVWNSRHQSPEESVAAEEHSHHS